MTLSELLTDKTKKAKEKVETISEWLIDTSLLTDDLLVFADKAKAPLKGTCIEALELATQQHPGIVDENVLAFVTNALMDATPRVQWESAKVIGNIAKLFPTKLNKPISNLLVNATADGTVVRWATAYALAEIVKINTEHNKTLLPILEKISEQEQNNAVKKKYVDAINKVKR